MQAVLLPTCWEKPNKQDSVSRRKKNHMMCIYLSKKGGVTKGDEKAMDERKKEVRG